MAKQTFTTGQVLLASQMTSLQQTAMGGGAATAKTASYVLVAADAGTTIIMNSGSATTITINDLLFAAGDTVNIQNIGAGICTITNGSATVNTAGSLALGQYEGGILYFRSASTATFFDYVQTGAVSPLTTKGDVWGYSTLDARIPVGTNNQVLTADSAQALGVKWATPTAAAFSGASVYRSSAQSIPSGTNTNVLWNAEYFDTNAYHDPTTNTDRLTVTTAGYYLFAASLTFGGNAAAGRQMELRRFNSSNVQQETRIFYYQWTTPNAVENVQGSAVYSCSAGDYFVAVARQDTGSAVDIRPITNGDTFASIVSLGA